MYRSFTLSALVTLFSITVFTQTPQPCNLNLAQAPTLRGLRLGMPAAAASEVLGAPLSPHPVQTRVAFVKSGDDYVRQSTQPIDPTNPTLLTNWYRNLKTLQAGNTSVELNVYGMGGLKDEVRKNVGQIRLEFFQDKLDSISVAYNFSDMPWNGKAEFLRFLSTKGGMPVAGWNSVQPMNRGPASEMRCRDFALTVEGDEVGFAYTVTLTDLNAQNQITKATKKKWLETLAAENERKKVFVP